MDTWRDLAELLVHVDIAIEELDGWATRTEDVERLGELERLSEEIQTAMRSRHLSRQLRRYLEQRDRKQLLAFAHVEHRE
jgi:hypothetical protein